MPRPSHRPSTLDQLREVHSLSALQQTVAQIRDPGDLYAIRGTETRVQLERIAAESADLRAPILALLGALDERRPGQDPVPIVAAFRQQVTALTGAEEEPEEAATPDTNLTPLPLAENGDADATLRQLLAAPGDHAQRMIAADALDDVGEPDRAALLRLEVLVRDPALTPTERAALDTQRAGHQFRHVQQTFARFGLPWPGDWRWDERADEGKQEQRVSSPEAAISAFAAFDVRSQLVILQALLRLPEQQASQHDLLRRNELLQEQNGHEGITGIDGQAHPLPLYDDLIGRLHGSPQEWRTLLFTKALQGFNQLLLVPFALPLRDLIGGWNRCLRRCEHLLPSRQGDDPSTPRLDRQQPVWLWEQAYGQRDGLGPDQDGRLVYFPERLGPDHGGRTKSELLAERPEATWQVVLVEGRLPNLPRAGQGTVIGGRKQVGTDRSARAYLRSCFPGEVGWTPETYVAAFCAQLELMGQVLDARTQSCLIASYLPAISGCVPAAYWSPGLRQANLDRFIPGSAVPKGGTRAAVRVV